MKQDNLEEINRQIEEELLNDMDNDSNKDSEKKGFMSMKFWIFFVILIIIIGKTISHLI